MKVPCTIMVCQLFKLICVFSPIYTDCLVRNRHLVSPWCCVWDASGVWQWIMILRARGKTNPGAGRARANLKSCIIWEHFFLLKLALALPAPEFVLPLARSLMIHCQTPDASHTQHGITYTHTWTLQTLWRHTHTDHTILANTQTFRPHTDLSQPQLWPHTNTHLDDTHN